MTPSSPRRRVLVLVPRPPYAWGSMDEIIPALTRTWRRLRRPGTKISFEFLSRSRSRRWNPPPEDFTDVALLCLHEFDYERLLARLAASPLAGARWWIHLHGEPQFGMLFAGNRFIPSRTVYLVASSAERRSLRLTRPFASCRVLPFPLGARVPAPARKSRRKSPPRESASPRLAYVGRLSEQKNIETVIRAVAMLRDGGRDCTLELIGRPDTLGDPRFKSDSAWRARGLRALVSRLGLDRAVAWRGWRDRRTIERTLDPTAIFVSASLHWDENFGAAAFAALRRGRRAVLSDWGGHRELARLFPGRVALVPVFFDGEGPRVDPARFARAILRTARKTRPFDGKARPGGWGPEEAAGRLGKWLEDDGLGAHGRRASGLAKALSMRTPRDQKAIFESRTDPLAAFFFKAYGAVFRGDE
ncbi:MAG: glycosyltransferase family 4 protein [Elusimicrobiota bacterium]